MAGLDESKRRGRNGAAIRWLPAAPALLLLALSGAACARETNMSSTGDEKAGVPPARDGNIAIRQELEAAREAATLEAYDLFIARHPDHPLAETARRERARLIARGQQR